jgi:hypothetical protein
MKNMNEFDLPEIKMGTKYLCFLNNLSDETLIFKEIFHDGCVILEPWKFNKLRTRLRAETSCPSVLSRQRTFSGGS